MSLPNVPLTTPVHPMPFHMSRQMTADVTGSFRLKLPFKGKLLGAVGAARASGGTAPTLTFDVLDDGTSILAAPKAITAGADAEAVVNDVEIADESVITVNFAIGGSAPTWDDVTVILYIARV